MTTPTTTAGHVLVLDVNETVSDLAPLASRFAELGVPAAAAAPVARGWFAAVLRDAFALSLAGTRPVFAEVAEAAATSELSRWPLDRPLGDAAAYVMAGVRTLGVHPDVAPGLRALRDAGVRVVTLSNGAADLAEQLLEDAGVRDCVEQVLSVEDAPSWKPACAAYEHAASACGVPLDRLVLVACHPWDVDGAARAGLGSVWVDRAGLAYPASFTPATHRVTSFRELPGLVGGGGAGVARSG